MSTTSPSEPITRTRRVVRAVRRFAHGAASWGYGISITLLLVGLWGRAASTDRPVIEEASAGAVESILVSDRVIDWAVDLASEELGRLPGDVEPTVRAIIADPLARAALGDVVRVLVDAALADEGATVVVDLRAAIEPHLGTVLQLADIAGADTSMVLGVLDEVTPVVVETGVVSPLGPAFAATERALRLAAVIAALCAIALFGLTLALSQERRVSARALAAKTFFGALGFAVMLQLGSWALDPGRGGTDAAPSLRSAVAVVARSNLHVPLLVAAAGGGVWLALRRRRRVDVFANRELAGDAAAVTSARFDVTGEVSLVPS